MRRDAQAIWEQRKHLLRRQFARELLEHLLIEAVDLEGLKNVARQLSHALAEALHAQGFCDRGVASADKMLDPLRRNLLQDDR